MLRSFQAEDDFNPKVFIKGMAPARLARNLERERVRIFRGVQKRMRSERRIGSAEWAESAEDWMMREVYRLVRQLRRVGHGTAFSQAIDKLHVRHKGRHGIGDQPFKQALFFIFGDLLVRALKSPLSRQRRSLLGDGLAYADLHGVPPKYVNGFIKQAGLKQCRAKLAARHCEPGFKFDRDCE